MGKFLYTCLEWSVTTVAYGWAILCALMVLGTALCLLAATLDYVVELRQKAKARKASQNAQAS